MKVSTCAHCVAAWASSVILGACSGTSPTSDRLPHPSDPGAASEVGGQAKGVTRAAGAAASVPATRVRVALAGDPLRYTQKELMTHGYPPRPDSVRSPDGYKRWLDAVSKPSVMITPVIVPLRNHHTTTTFSGIWSGFENNTPSGGYSLVGGGWNVPTVTADPSQDTASTTWVGIDGDGLGDLWQAGTDQWAPAGGTPQYFAWFEYVPVEPYEVQVTSGQDSSGEIVNFPVNPGDYIYSAVMVGDSSGNPVSGGTVLWYLLDNETQGVTTDWQSIPEGPVASGSVPGAEAEWIMERPTSGATGNPFPLASYGQVNINTMLMADDSGWYFSPIMDSTLQIQMVAGDSRTLSSVSDIDGASFLATFVSSN